MTLTTLPHIKRQQPEFLQAWPGVAFGHWSSLDIVFQIVSNSAIESIFLIPQPSLVSVQAASRLPARGLRSPSAAPTVSPCRHAYSEPPNVQMSRPPGLH